MTDRVRVDVEDGVATVTLQDPDVRNALTAEMATELQDAVATVEGSDARCLVLEGSAGYFCAGGDVAAMREGVESEMPIEQRLETYAVPVNNAVQAVAECPIPTVAAVDGPAFGAGGTLAIACDVLLASERSKLSFGFRQVGLSVDSGTSALLTRLVGENVAKELVYTGELLDSERASDLGLFNRVFPTEEFEERAQGVVDRIATGPTVALRESKRLIEGGHNRTVAEAIEAEADGLRTVLATDDHEAGVRAFFEGRDPAFDGE